MYDYREAMAKDILSYIKEEEISVTTENREEVEERLYDDLFICDSVTGNASGSYTFNSYEAAGYVKDNMGLCKEALQEFCTEPKRIADAFLNEEWEFLDVTIRCYLLAEVLSDVLDTLENQTNYIDTLPEAEKTVREKLNVCFSEEFEGEWQETFETGSTDECISCLYDSFCDESFWYIAKVTVSEIKAYLTEKEAADSEWDIEDSYRMLGSIVSAYIDVNAKDLLK